MPGDHRAGPRPSGRDLATNQGTQRITVNAARVLPNLPGHLRSTIRPGHRQPRSQGRPAIAPTPAAAAKLTVSRIAAALRRAGRSRNIEQTATEIRTALHAPQMRQPAQVEAAMGKQTLALLAALNTACASVDDLGQAVAELFQTHPDYAIITSFSGLGDSTGARVLAELGDDRARFADASVEGLRRISTRHQGLRAIYLHHAPSDQERPARCRRMDLGIRRSHPL